MCDSVRVLYMRFAAQSEFAADAVAAAAAAASIKPDALVRAKVTHRLVVTVNGCKSYNERARAQDNTHTLGGTGTLLIRNILHDRFTCVCMCVNCVIGRSVCVCVCVTVCKCVCAAVNIK